MIKINMGSGPRNFGEEWHHIDGGSYEHLNSKDVQNLPYDDDTVDLIYASHLIEYFDREQIIDVLAEWRRVLKPGGTLRLAVPDFEVMTKLYSQGHKLDKFLGPIFGKIKMASDTVYHKTVYDYDSLKSLLECCGYSDIKKYDWRQTEHSQFDDHSQAYIPHMDKENGVLISLNIECVK